VDQVEVGKEAIFGRVHAHGGDNDAVGQGQVLDGEGLKQQGNPVCIGERGVDGAQVRSNGVGVLVVVFGLGELGLGLDDGLDGFVAGVVLEGGHFSGNLVGVLVVVERVVKRVIARRDVDVDVDMEVFAVLSCWMDGCDFFGIDIPNCDTFVTRLLINNQRLVNVSQTALFW